MTKTEQRKAISLPIEAVNLIKEVKTHLDQTMGASVRFTDSSVIMLVLKYYINERVKK